MGPTLRWRSLLSSKSREQKESPASCRSGNTPSVRAALPVLANPSGQYLVQCLVSPATAGRVPQAASTIAVLISFTSLRIADIVEDVFSTVEDPHQISIAGSGKLPHTRPVQRGCAICNSFRREGETLNATALDP